MDVAIEALTSGVLSGFLAKLALDLEFNDALWVGAIAAASCLLTLAFLDDVLEFLLPDIEEE